MAEGFVPIPDSIMARVDLTPGHKLVLCAIARLQGDKASCFPGYDWISTSTGISRRQVIRIVNDLVARKEMKRLRCAYQSNSYSVPWATAKAMRKKWAIQRAQKIA